MAIEWGAWEGSGVQQMRVGVEVSWESITHGETAATATVDYWTDNSGNFDDDQSLNLGGSIDGTISFHNGAGTGAVKRGTRTYTYNYGSNEYGSSPGSRTFSATLSGAYNGVTPTKSNSSSIPGRPIAAPAAPTNVSVSRVSDGSQKVTWTNKDTSGEPWDRVRVQRDDGANAVWNGDVGTPSGSSTSFTDSATNSNSAYRYRVRSENNAGDSAWVETSIVYTTPDAPTGATRTNGTGAQQVVTWTNQASSFMSYLTEVQRGVTDPATHVTTWTTIASSVASGTVTYTDPAASASQATKYRVRHKTSGGVQGTLYSDWSGETTSTPGVTQPPLAPAKLSPNGLTVDPTLQQRLSWVFTPSMAGDTQAAFTLQHRVAGTPTWTTVAQTTANQYYDLPANTYLVDQTIEWQVSTKGADPNYGPYANPVTFKTAIVPVPADPVKVPVQMDLSTGQLEANTNAYELRDMVMRIQSNVLGGGVRAVDASYNLTWSQRFIAIALGNSDATFPMGHHDIVNPFGWTVNNKQIVVTNGVPRATLTVSTSNVQVRTGETITVQNVGAPYDGQFTCRSVSSNQVSYDLPAGTAAQGATAATGGVFATIHGHGGAVDAVPASAKINLPSWTALYYELPFGWGGGSTVKKNGIVNVTSKQVTATNVGTLGIAGGHWFAMNDRVVVSIGDALYDGERTITSVTPTSVSFAVTSAANSLTSITDPAAVLKPSGKDTFFGNFHLVYFNGDFVVPSNWVMLALRNVDGGTVEWGTGDTVDPGYDSDSPVFKQAIFTSTADVNASGGNKPALRIGSVTGTHLRIDGNEIQAMGGDASTGTLNFQLGGGTTTVGGTLTVQGNLDNTGMPTGSYTANVNANTATNNRLRVNTSSRRFKENIRDIVADPRKFLRLGAKLFQRNDEIDEEASTDGETVFKPVDETSPWYVGFIAEEAEELGLRHWVTYDADGEPFGFAYDYWSVALHMVCQDQQKRIDDLERRLAALENKGDD